MSFSMRLRGGVVPAALFFPEFSFIPRASGWLLVTITRPLNNFRPLQIWFAAEFIRCRFQGWSMVLPAEFRALIRRVRDGDSEAQHLLVSEYSDHLKNFIRRRVRTRQMLIQYDTDDCVASVWESVLVRSGPLDDVDSADHFMRLLVKCANNKLFDEERRARGVQRDYRRQVDLPGSSQSPVAAAPGPEELAIVREEMGVLAGELSTLSRHVLGMAMEGHNSEETARRLPGMNPRRIRHIRERIMAWWRDRWNRS